MTQADAQQSADLWFELPAGFTEVDLDESPEDRMLRLAEAIEPMFSASPEQRLAAVLSCQYAIESLLDEGAVHMSHCLFHDEEEGFTQGILTLFVKEGKFKDRRGVAERTDQQWKAEAPAAETSVVELPYGPAAVAAEEHENRVPGAMYGVPEDQVSVVRQLRVAIPLFSGDKTALFVFTTEDVDNWENYVRIVVSVMHTVSPVEPRDTDAMAVPGAESTNSAAADAVRSDFG